MVGPLAMESWENVSSSGRGIAVEEEHTEHIGGGIVGFGSEVRVGFRAIAGDGAGDFTEVGKIGGTDERGWRVWCAGTI